MVECDEEKSVVGKSSLKRKRTTIRLGRRINVEDIEEASERRGMY